MRLLEVYAGQAACEMHLTTPHFLSCKAQTAAMVLRLRMIPADPILLAAKPDQ